MPFQFRLGKQLPDGPQLIGPVGGIERIVAIADFELFLLQVFGADIEVLAIGFEISEAPEHVEPLFVTTAVLRQAERSA